MSAILVSIKEKGYHFCLVIPKAKIFFGILQRIRINKNINTILKIIKIMYI